jgi:predicted KAP-like P-loop ATPase
VNVVDFLALEALRVFLPDLHGSLAEEQDLFLQRGRYSNDGQGPAQIERLKELIALAPEGQRETAEAALKELFPAIRGHLGDMHYGSEWQTQWTQEKRVCSIRYFPQYFELQTPEGEMSESEFTQLIAASGNRQNLDSFINALRERDLLKSLASRIDESFSRLPVENASTLLPALFSLAEELSAYEEASPFGSPWISAWRGISHYIGRLPPQQRGPEVMQALKETKALNLTATLIYLSSPEDHQPGSAIERSIDEASVRELKAEWVKIIDEMASTPSDLLAKPTLASLLYRWRDYSGDLSAPRAWVASVTVDDAAFVKFVQALVSRGTSHSAGDLVSSQTRHFQRDTVEHFLGVESARQRLSGMHISSLTDEENADVELLRKHIDEWMAKDREDLVS